MRALSHFGAVGGNVLSGGMSYQALFAVFAALWVGFGFFGAFLSDKPELLNTLIEQINTSVPGLIGEQGIVNVKDLLAGQTLTWTSAIAAASLLLLVSNWFNGTRGSIRLIFGLDVKEYKSAAVLKLRDFALALVFGVAIVVSAALTALSSNLTDSIFGWLGWNTDSWVLGWLGTIARYALMFAFDVLVLMAMHRYLAEVKIERLRLFYGCLIGGAALLVVKVLGTALLGGAGKNPLLATFAVLIGVLLWFNIICRILLLTASWIATGLDKDLGLPLPLAAELEADREDAAREATEREIERRVAERQAELARVSDQRTVKERITGLFRRAS